MSKDTKGKGGVPESTGNIPFHPDSVEILNKLMTPNEYCDSHYKPEIKPGWVDEESRFFGTHIREVIRMFKEVRK